ncbi:hypothetical protein E3E22_09275 [Thermococcus sp. MV5]|uniref:hypothetical protein n=1 Tax=Thermococcus sp. MV5 TaxID=1638272 RepID=UPI00143C1927|nr:hypothetical protein [Thermococcus sp. MV5]NJE26799.1 hypothetical protein [Thermococcus sp. MV5]
MQKVFSLILVALLVTSISGCISRDTSTSPSVAPTDTQTPSESTTPSGPQTSTTTPTEAPSINKEELIKSLESVKKYQFTLEYSTIPESDTKISAKGGFDFTKEEAFWEIATKSGDFITYSNETVWDDYIYYSTLVKQDGKLIQKDSQKIRLREYFEKVIKGRTQIATPEEFKEQLFKGADPTRNPLYYTKDLLESADSLKATREGEYYVVTFPFAKEEEITLNSITKIVKTQGTVKLWLENKLPIKGEIQLTRTVEYVGLEKVSTTKALVKFEVSYIYEKPEWVKKVIG